jgi:molybdate transport system regulatory protein
MTPYQVRSKVWLEFNGLSFLSGGSYQLLSAVASTGSINAAAKALGISYRKAWAQLEAMEEHAPFPLLERRSGGKGGGETQLTEEALDLLAKFYKLNSEVQFAVDHYFSIIFS